MQAAHGALEIGGRRGPSLRLRNPVLAASGCFVDGVRIAGDGHQAPLGGVVTPTITPHTRRPRPGRLIEAPAGVLYDAEVAGQGVAVAVR